MKKSLLALLFLIHFSSIAQLGAISGQITSETKEPLPGASIALVGTVRGVESNAKGNYVLKGLKPGQYTIKVSFVGYKPSLVEVTLNDGEQREENISLSDVTELQGVSVFAQSGVKGNTFLPQVNDYTITAGKKNDHRTR